MQCFFFCLKGWTGLIVNLGLFNGRREINLMDLRNIPGH